MNPAGPSFDPSIVSFASRWLATFWERRGYLQTYLDFILTEINPQLSRLNLNAKVIEVIQETADAKTYVLKPPAHWRSKFQAGMHLQIGVEINGTRVRRTYSFSCAPSDFARSGTIRFTAKRIADGRVSNWLFNNLKPGQLIQIAPASGIFTLEQCSDANLLFLAGGSGITPFFSMLNEHLNEPDSRTFNLIYYCRHQGDVIFAKQLDALQRRHSDRFSLNLVLTDDQGQMNREQLLRDCPDLTERAVLLCGPQGFMDAAQALLKELGVGAECIFQESFGTPVRLFTATDAGTSDVRFTQAGLQVTGDGTKTILELAEEAGLTPKYGCRAGVCHECKCTKRGGQVMDVRSGEVSLSDEEEIQVCISIPVGPVEVNL